MSDPRTNSIATLLEHREWLSRLARRLLEDPEDARDLTQEAWLEAVRRPPPNADAPRAWLATVTRRVAARRFRSRGERASQLQDLEEEPASLTETPSQLVERASLQRDLVDATLRLDEPYRTTLLLRYFEERSPTQIARRLDVPLPTIKARLNRGLAKLRRQLDRRHGEDGSWRAALLPLASLAGTTSKSKGVILMAFFTLCIGLLALGQLGIRDVPTGEGDVTRTALPVDLADVEFVRAEDGAPALVTRTLIEFRNSASASNEEVWLEVRDETGRTVPEARVRVLRSEDMKDVLIGESSAGTTDGRYRFDAWTDRSGTDLSLDAAGRVLLPAGTLYAMAETETHWCGSTVPKDAEGMQLVLQPKEPLTVTVVDHQGSPAADVLVSVSAIASEDDDPSSRTTPNAGSPRIVYESRTDAFGRVTSDRAHILARQISPTGRVFCEVEIPRARRIGCISLLGEANARIVLPETAPWILLPYEGMKVHRQGLALLEAAPGTEHEPRAFPPPQARERFGAEGVTLPYVPLHMKWRVQLFTNDGLEIHLLTGPKVAGERLTTTLERPRTPFVEAILTDRGGTPLAHHAVAVMQSQENSHGSYSGMRRDSTDADGRLSFTVDPQIVAGAPMVLALVVRPGRDSDVLYEYETAAIQVPTGGPILLGRLALDPSPPLLAGVVLDPQGRPMSGIVLFVERREKTMLTSRRQVVTDAQGRFQFVEPSRTRFAAKNGLFRVSAAGAFPVSPVDAKAGDLDIVFQVGK